MSESFTKLIATLILIFMLGLAFFSMRGDTAIMDEVSHLPAGYSYVSQLDMRINPEHPPMIKDLAGLAVRLWAKIAGVQINFPYHIKAWTQDINGQWDFGFDFMYKEGNPADSMLFFGRLPMMLILLILGIYIFKWTRQLWGKAAALLTLFLFAFSPTFLAHGRFITTDVAAAAGFFIATYYFIRWLKNPGTKNLILAGIFFGLAQLAKFSLFLLVPLFGFLMLLWIIVKIFNQTSQPVLSAKRDLVEPTPQKVEIKKDSALKIAWRYLAGLAIIFLIGYGLVVTPVYWPHVKNYPVQKQIEDMRFILKSYAGGPDQQTFASCKDLARIKRCPAELVVWITDKNIVLRSFAQYLFGLLMVVQRAAGGNTTYFMGEVSASGWHSYFPIVYLLKEPLALHILTLMAIGILAYRSLKKKFGQPTTKAQEPFVKRGVAWLNLNFESLAMLSFIALYWATSIRSPLNIGVRHVLPTFPFIYALVSSQVISWVRTKKEEKKIFSSLKYAIVLVLVAWQAVSVLAIYPSFLAYFNELIRGSKNGYKVVVDSNLDWGQDLKRLKQWTDENKIEKIYVDYFGGGDAKYYLGDKFQPWWGTRSPSGLKSGDYLAVSATFLQGGRGKPVPGFTQEHSYYLWLDSYQPVTTIGYSIFVYRIP